jgi:hypothetical protein
LGVIGRLLWFELRTLISRRSFGRGFFGQLFFGLILEFTFGHRFIFFLCVILLLCSNECDFGRCLLNAWRWLLVKVLCLFVILPRSGVHSSLTN